MNSAVAVVAVLVAVLLLLLLLQVFLSTLLLFCSVYDFLHRFVIDRTPSSTGRHYKTVRRRHRTVVVRRRYIGS
jgi:hypothetical protein